MGVQPLGGLRRPLVPADGLRGRARVLVVRRDRRRGRVLAALERPRDREVHVTTAGRAERGVGGVPDPAVAEVVGVRALRADDPAPPQLVQRGHEGLLVQPGGSGQHVRGERLADGRGDPGRGSGGRREPGQAACDNRRSLLRGRGAGSQRLDDEQRVALAVAVQAVEPGRVERCAGDALGQHGRLLAAEPAEPDLGAPAERMQGRGHGGERVVLVEFLAPGGGRDEQPRRRRGADQVVDLAQRLGVGPLRVVHDELQRRARGQQRAADRAEQPVPQLRLGQRFGRRGPRGQLGQQPGEFGQVGAAEPGQPRGDRRGAEPCRGDPVRKRAFRGIGASLRGHRARLRAQFVGQPGLADAGLAGDEHQPRMPGRRCAPHRGQPGPLGGAPGERRRAGGLLGLPDGDQRLVNGAGFRRGIDAELALQRRGAHVVGAHGPGPVPGRLAEPDQPPVVLLAQGIPRDQALGAADGFGPPPVLLVLAGEPLQRVGVQPGEPLPVRGQPFVVAALEQPGQSRNARRCRGCGASRWSSR